MFLGWKVLYEINACVCVYLVHVLVEMWPPSTQHLRSSFSATKKLIDFQTAADRHSRVCFYVINHILCKFLSTFFIDFLQIN